MNKQEIIRKCREWGGWHTIKYIKIDDNYNLILVVTETGADLIKYGFEEFTYIREFRNIKHAEFTFELLTQAGNEFTPF